MSACHTLQRIVYKSGNIPKPEVNQNNFRLYGHTLCPFVARARYALSAKNIPFQDCQVDLNEKAAWHLELNGGLVPILETPQGDQIIESSIIMQLAIELGGSDGVELVPKDPIQAAKLRIQIEKFNSTVGPFWPVVMTRGEDDAAIDKFGDVTLQQWEQLALKAESNQVWLFGTKDLTLLDIVAGSIFEILYLQQFTAYQNVTNRLKLEEKAPNFIKYVERFREHPAIKPYRMNKRATLLHHQRARGWQKGVKCQLSYHELEDGSVFLDENI